MKNPLRHRFLRELKEDFGKYCVIFLLLCGSIGFVSGFLVADGSMIIAYQESFEKYNVEDGNFKVQKQLNKAQKKSIESEGVVLTDNFYIEDPLTNGSTLRIFKNRQEVNTVCVMAGSLPISSSEIAIDRMYADNNGLRIGDVIEGKSGKWMISGLIAMPDYSCLFSDNSDSMFDAVKFGVAIVNESGFLRLDEAYMEYSYSWQYVQEPADEDAEKEAAEALMKVLVKETSLEEFIPRYANQAIQFTGEDMGSDKAMMTVLLYIIILIMAFVFAVTTSNTIQQESGVIGTLRAMGFTKRELIRHYMTMPMIVTLFGALIGNILGYSVFKDVCAAMYYGSYSLVTYETRWNAEAFIMTTVIPLLIMAAINFILLKRSLNLSPLKFLRHDLRKNKQKGVIPLSKRIPFFSRFRIRILAQNMYSYLLLFVGILFANLLLVFGLSLPSILDHYQEEIANNLLADYQTILKVPLDLSAEDHRLENMIKMLMFANEVETENESAEKFSVTALKTIEDEWKSEEITVYGIIENSAYVPLNVQQDHVYISSSYADKYRIDVGDTIILQQESEDRLFEFTVDAITDYSGTLSVFMNQKDLNTLLDLDENTFMGYFSSSPLTDIKDEYISSVIDLDALTKISRQLDVSMGNMMYLVDGFAVIMFMILIYLLSKMVIEKNAQSISMAKILGYNNSEISSLYILSTTIAVVVFLVLSLPIETKIMDFLFRYIMMTSLTGWMTFYMDPIIYAKMLLLGFATYAVVAVMQLKKIRKVPMDEALKNVE